MATILNELKKQFNLFLLHTFVKREEAAMYIQFPEKLL